MKEGGYIRGEMIVTAALSEGAKSALCPFPDLNRTPLMQLNPNSKENCNDPRRLLEIIFRFNNPWEEHVDLPSPVGVIADTFDLNEHHPVVGLILANKVEEYTVADFFEGGDPNTILLRVITIDNGGEIATALEGKTAKEEGFWRRELLYFADKEPHIFVSDGHIYISNNYPRKNLLLWDGVDYRLIAHKEHDGYVPREDWLVGDTPITIGGYNVKDRIKGEVELLNLKNKGSWKGRLVPDKLVGKPYFIIQNTYLFFGEVATDVRSMLNYVLVGGKND